MHVNAGVLLQRPDRLDEAIAAYDWAIALQPAAASAALAGSNRNAPWPADATLQVPMMSLPHRFGTVVDMMPAGAAYLHAGARRMGRLRAARDCRCPRIA